MFPFIYTADKSIQVKNETADYLEKNPEIKSRIQNLYIVYHSLHDLIPVTFESFWSGHNFPYSESWDDLQISFTLCQFGLYKQAMGSLRSALELGLLSVYYNINDQGHETVKKWLRSSPNKEADTPRMGLIWKILIAHPNIAKFQSKVDIQQQLLDLGFLHNYVHTKGHKFSNGMGMMKSNFQTFEEESFMKWQTCLESIIEVVCILHLLKYPAGMIRYDYSRKFGIDIPSFSHLQESNLDRIENLFPKDKMELLSQISSEDTGTTNFINWIESHEDKTEQDVEDQIVEMDKRDIERQGFKFYKTQQLVLYRAKNFKSLPDNVKLRVKNLEKWAKENGCIIGKYQKRLEELKLM